ncbi:hypothetical protein TcCL_NonESM06147 [Trypanosoma cruzi]|nr:hypothetical protein TcCL_NonESM06147 [Trypanosoma cruzi]
MMTRCNRYGDRSVFTSHGRLLEKMSLDLFESPYHPIGGDPASQLLLRDHFSASPSLSSNGCGWCLAAVASFSPAQIKWVSFQDLLRFFMWKKCFAPKAVVRAVTTPQRHTRVSLNRHLHTPCHGLQNSVCPVELLSKRARGYCQARIAMTLTTCVVKKWA